MRSALARLEAGRIGAFEFGGVVHHKKAAQHMERLQRTDPNIAFTARSLEDDAPKGRTTHGKSLHSQAPDVLIPNTPETP